MERRKLEEMPFDKRFDLPDGNEGLCHATGWEICDGDPNIARLNTKFDTDEAAVKHAQDFLDSFDVIGGDDV